MSNAKSDAEEQIRRQVREFQERTSSKIRAGNYGPEDFMGGIAFLIHLIYKIRCHKLASICRSY